MMEYTLAAVVMLVLAMAANLRWNTAVRQSPRAFAMALSLAAVAQLVFDNVTVWRGFWQFNEAAISGIRVPFMPIENLLFGLALFLFTVLAWEKAGGKATKLRPGFRA